MRDGCMDIYTDAQTISIYTDKTVLNYVCYTQVIVIEYANMRGI